MSETTVLLYSIIAALIPTLLYVGLIYWVDRYEKEPWWLLTAVFLWGAIPSIIIAYIFNTLFSLPVYLVAAENTAATLTASFIAPPVEETIKGLAIVIIFFRWRHEIDSPLDGIIYGAMVGMGFAMVENVYYFTNVYAQGGAEAWGINIFLRGIVFGFNHALFSSMTGLGVAIARMNPHSFLRFVAPLAGWLSAMFFHFLHNFSVSFGNLLCILALIFDWGGIFLTLLIIIWAVLQERRWIRDYLKEEVGLGVITLQQYQTACSGRKRNSARLRLLFSRGFRAYRRASRFYYRCSELAYKKHHHALFQDDESARFIHDIRGELAAISQQGL